MNDIKIIQIRSFLTALLMFSAAFFAEAGWAGVCWKSSYGRGVGTIPDTCSPGQTKSGLLCYENCKPGYYNVAGVCWQSCPKTLDNKPYRDHGAFCRHPVAEYGRGGGYPWQFGDGFNLDRARDRCQGDQLARESGGCEQSGLLMYPRCKPGYNAVGCCICTLAQKCPAGWTEVAGSCQKKSEVKAPKLPNCGTKQYDAGLCYTACKPGFDNVGPVCWGKCPSDKPKPCAGLCATTQPECAMATTEMVMSVAHLARKVASAIASFGTSTLLDVATEVARNAIEDLAKKAAMEAVKLGVGAIMKESSKLGLPPAAATAITALAGDPAKVDAVSILKKLDITGISKVVDAFKKEVCTEPGKPPPALDIVF